MSTVTAEEHTALCAGLLQRLHRQRGAGHRGRAADRNLDKATVWADKTRAAWAHLISGPSELPMVEVQYLDSLSKLCEELAREGEPDFDGLLRNGINFLQNAGRKVCW